MTPVSRAWWLVILAGLAILPGVVVADASLAATLRGLQQPSLLAFMQLVTWLGYGAVDIGIPLLVGIRGWWRRDRHLRNRGILGGATVAAAGLLDQLLKNVACRARPSAPGAGSFFSGFPCFPAQYAQASFPSGHATTAFAVAMLLVLWYPRWASLYVGAAVLVGVSRILLGSHFPSDVLAGALLGSAVALCAHAYSPAVRRPDASARAGAG